MKENFKMIPRNKKIIEFDFDFAKKLKIKVGVFSKNWKNKFNKNTIKIKLNY